MKPSTNKFLLSLAAASLLSMASAAMAAPFVYQASWPKSPMGTVMDADPTLQEGVKYVYEWGIGLGGIAVFIVLVMAGFQYITSVGDPTKMKEAFRRIEEAVVGLLILLSSYAILNLVGINLKQLNVTMAGPTMTPSLKTCTGTEGDAAPECCDGVTNCISDLWTCIGSDGTTEGHCEINTKTETCSEVVIYYTDGSKFQPDLTPGNFNRKMPLSTGKTVAKMERYYQPSTGGKVLCYDSTNPDAKDAGVHKPCNCSIQILTKLSSTTTGGNTTDPCSNTSGEVFSVHTEDFVSNDNSIKIVCILVNAPK
jgi:hypothetical protein